VSKIWIDEQSNVEVIQLSKIIIWEYHQQMCNSNYRKKYKHQFKLELNKKKKRITVEMSRHNDNQ